MDLDKLSSSAQTIEKTTEVLKPTTEIAKIMSNEYLKTLELNEYCKIIESDLKKCQTKIEALNNAKNQSIRLRAEYITRNKINKTNYESLLQVLNELYKYKCELKSEFVAAEKALKFKRLKYKKIIQAYESSWEEALNEYSSNPIVVELLKVEQDNFALELEIDGQEKLNTSMKTQLVQLKKNVENAFLEKTVEFARTVIQYKEFVNLQKLNRKHESVKFQKTDENFEFKLFKAKILRSNEKTSLSSDNNDDSNTTCNIDVSVFDEIIVPSEKLESQYMEEDGYPFAQNEEHVPDFPKDQENSPKYLNNRQQTVEPKNKCPVKNPKENSMQASAKTSAMNNSENIDTAEWQSRAEENFYRQRNNGERFGTNPETEKTKSQNTSAVAGSHQMESEGDTPRDIQMECEECLSEGNYDKQFISARENYEYQKSSSISSDDMPSTGGNLNESLGSSRLKIFKDEQSSSFKPKCEAEKNDFKSFGGFFTMGNGRESPTSSIFKLF